MSDIKNVQQINAARLENYNNIKSSELLFYRIRAQSRIELNNCILPELTIE